MAACRPPFPSLPLSVPLSGPFLGWFDGGLRVWLPNEGGGAIIDPQGITITVDGSEAQGPTTELWGASGVNGVSVSYTGITRPVHPTSITVEFPATYGIGPITALDGQTLKLVV